MNEWVKVDTSEINKEVSKDIQGVHVKVSFSPYDVPREWRGQRDDMDSDFFIIEFRYLLDEETHTEAPSANFPIQLDVGNNSKRIYKIRLNTSKLGSEFNGIGLKIEPLVKEVVGAIKEFSTTVPLKLRERYKMPEKLISNKRKEMFAEIAG
jgi:hypothetical protein